MWLLETFVCLIKYISINFITLFPINNNNHLIFWMETSTTQVVLCLALFLLNGQFSSQRRKCFRSGGKWYEVPLRVKASTKLSYFTICLNTHCELNDIQQFPYHMGQGVMKISLTGWLVETEAAALFTPSRDFLEWLISWNESRQRTINILGIAILSRLWRNVEDLCPSLNIRCGVLTRQRPKEWGSAMVIPFLWFSSFYVYPNSQRYNKCIHIINSMLNLL